MVIKHINQTVECSRKYETVTLYKPVIKVSFSVVLLHAFLEVIMVSGCP